MNHGFLYIATGKEKFTFEALRSVKTLKRFFPMAKAALITDRFLLNASSSYSIFDQVIVVKSFSTSKDWSENLCHKVSGLLLSPFEYTVFLDTDTLIRSDEIKSIFKHIQNFDLGITVATPSTSRCSRLLGKKIYYTGFIAYNAKSEKVQKLLNAWKEKQHENFKKIAKREFLDDQKKFKISESEARFLIGTDQFSLSAFLTPEHNPENLKVRVLSNKWNYHDAFNEPQDIIVDTRPYQKFSPAVENEYGHFKPFFTIISETFLGLTEQEISDFKSFIYKQLKPVQDGYVSAQGENSIRTQGNLFDHDDICCENFLARLYPHVKRMLGEMFLGGGRSNLAKIEIKAIYGWAYALKEGAFLTTHQHTSAVISGVYYVGVPSAISHKNSGGDLILYNPNIAEGFLLRSAQVLSTVTIKPFVDKLVLFPSYTWHNVTPFHGEGDRICVSFDVILS